MELRLRYKPTKKSARVVVDEVFENGTVRLLRAPRSAPNTVLDLGMDHWADEQELFMKAAVVEAFVGYPKGVHLREGDVFFLRDGSQLKSAYSPIERSKARAKHLLIDFQDSLRFVRGEAKERFRALFVTQVIKEPKGREKVLAALQGDKVETTLEKGRARRG